MHRVVAQVEEERPVGVPLDERDRLVGFPVGQVLARSPRRQVRKRRPLVLGGIRIEVMGRVAEVAAAGVEVEPLALGEPLLGPEVPFADEAGGVPARLEHLGDGHLVELHPARVVGGHELAPRPADVLRPAADLLLGPRLAGQRPNPVGDADAGRIPAGQDRGPGR